MKDIIIRGGENISAREVEEVLARHPAVADVAVCATPDEVWGEAVCAVVVPRCGTQGPTVQVLGHFASSAGLAPHKLPTKVVFTDSLPRTAAGKVRKRDLRLCSELREQRSMVRPSRTLQVSGSNPICGEPDAFLRRGASGCTP